MSRKPKYIAIAEQNVLELVTELINMQSMLDGLSVFGNAVTHDHVAKRQYFDGLSQMRSAIYAEYCHAMVRAMPFAWMGGKAQGLSKRLMAEWFDEDKRREIASFLEHWCQMPGMYEIEPTEVLRSEVNEALNERSQEEQ